MFFKPQSSNGSVAFAIIVVLTAAVVNNVYGVELAVSREQVVTGTRAVAAVAQPLARDPAGAAASPEAVLPEIVVTATRL
jgi:hypothetical protein